MLVRYIYVSHALEDLQSWMEHLVLQVWCRHGGAYSVALLCPELQQIAAEVDIIDTNERSIFDEIRDLDAAIQGLAPDKRNDLAQMFRDSTEIDALCAGAPGIHPYNFAELKAWNKTIAGKLKDFFYDLFDKHIKWGPIKKRLGDLKSHVDLFSASNREAICPFCGLQDLRDENFTTRDDYDHFLPRHKYPFNSVNFRNLAPMCSTCNSSYKGQKDPISRAEGYRQRAYAPYNPAVTFPGITIALDPAKISMLTPDDINITFHSATHQEEVDTWEWLFGIRQRYRGKLCQKRGAFAWLNAALKESANYNVSPAQVLATVNSNAAADPFLDDGFLKAATLESCKSAGLI